MRVSWQETGRLQRSDRSRILKLLGIDIWVTRSNSVDLRVPETAVAEASRPDTPIPEGGSAPGDVSVLTRQLREGLAASGPRPVAAITARPATAPAIAADTPQEAAITGSDLQRTQVLSLRSPRLLLLVEVQDLKYARRLASDLLLAGEGDWQSALTQTVFDWRPDQAVAAGVSGLRALAAFVDKQLDDVGSGSGVIVCQRVLDLLPDLVDTITRRQHHCVVVPGLRELAQDGEAKQSLWRQIQQLKAR